MTNKCHVRSKYFGSLLTQMPCNNNKSWIHSDGKDLRLRLHHLKCYLAGTWPQSWDAEYVSLAPARSTVNRVKLLWRELKKAQGWLELDRNRAVSEPWSFLKAQVQHCLWVPTPELSPKAWCIIKHGFLQNILVTRALREDIPVLQILLTLRRFDPQNARPNKSALP